MKQHTVLFMIIFEHFKQHAEHKEGLRLLTEEDRYVKGCS